MPLLEDGSEKGLKGHFKEDFSHRTRAGLAPRAGHIDRTASPPAPRSIRAT